MRGLDKLLLLEANNQGIRKRGVDEMQFLRFVLLAITFALRVRGAVKSRIGVLFIKTPIEESV